MFRHVITPLVLVAGLVTFVILAPSGIAQTLPPGWYKCQPDARCDSPTDGCGNPGITTCYRCTSPSKVQRCIPSAVAPPPPCTVTGGGYGQCGSNIQGACDTSSPRKCLGGGPTGDDCYVYNC